MSCTINVALLFFARALFRILSGNYMSLYIKKSTSYFRFHTTALKTICNLHSLLLKYLLFLILASFLFFFAEMHLEESIEKAIKPELCVPLVLLVNCCSKRMILKENPPLRNSNTLLNLNILR